MKSMNRLFFNSLRFALLVVLIPCCMHARPNDQCKIGSPLTATLHKGLNKNITLEDSRYDIYLPESVPERTLLVLPGWDFPKESWMENSDLKQYAEKYKTLLILPDMRRTIYESKYYKETNLKWGRHPGSLYIHKYLIPDLQEKYALLLPCQKNGVLGLSTGGRGVAMMMLDHPDIFKAGVALSGDFNQEEMKQDRLMSAVYGAFVSFKERWKGNKNCKGEERWSESAECDNPENRIDEWKGSILLAHGSADPVVAVRHSRNFADKLKARHPDLNIRYIEVKGARHDYRFWNSQLPSAFEFLVAVE